MGVVNLSELLGAETYFDLPLREELEVAELLYERKYRRVEWNLRRAPHSALAGLEEVRGLRG
ncbi:MAG: hypothetical protein QW230_04990 [Thermofilum sp.]